MIARLHRLLGRRGVVLLTALWLVSLIGILVLSLVHRIRLNMTLHEFRRDELHARTLLASGWARALAAIRADGDFDVDHGGESWSAAPSMIEEDLIPNELRAQSAAAVRWRAVDEGAKVNLNTAALEVIENVLAAYYISDVEPKALAGYLKDWTDADDEGGAESEHYAAFSPAISPRNAPATSIEEFAAVRGVSEWLFEGEDANGNDELDANEDDGARRPPFDNADDELQPGLRDLFTIWGDGTLNVNTAPIEILSAVFGTIVDSSKATEYANEIHRARTGPDGLLGTQDDTPLRSNQQIAQIVGADVYEKCKRMGARLGVKSQAFSVGVYVRMETANLEARGEGLVLREDDAYRVAYWRPER